MDEERLLWIEKRVNEMSICDVTVAWGRELIEEVKRLQKETVPASTHLRAVEERNEWERKAMSQRAIARDLIIENERLKTELNELKK